MDGERSTKLTQLSVTYLRIISMIIGRYLTINTKERTTWWMSKKLVRKRDIDEVAYTQGVV